MPLSTEALSYRKQIRRCACDNGGRGESSEARRRLVGSGALDAQTMTQKVSATSDYSLMVSELNRGRILVDSVEHPAPAIGPETLGISVDDPGTVVVINNRIRFSAVPMTPRPTLPYQLGRSLASSACCPLTLKFA